MALMLGGQEINSLAAFAGWNSIQKKIRMRDHNLSSVVYEFYVKDGEAILSSEFDVIQAENAQATNATIKDGVIE